MLLVKRKMKELNKIYLSLSFQINSKKLKSNCKLKIKS